MTVLVDDAPPRDHGRPADDGRVAEDGRDRVGGDPEASAFSGDARAARRAVASAQRERRKYERSEVRRFTQRSRRRRMAWLIGIAAVVVVAGGAVGAAYSPLMALRDVRIEGAQRIPIDALQGAFAGEIGTPLPLVTSADVRTALSAFPLIETYSTETIPLRRSSCASSSAHRSESSRPTTDSSSSTPRGS
ncbi:hypothetical protein [Agromyces protaetiae]|uniref:hypothetical protein n=1 Tax=Agromyces protaetiae TaxID=2509455 RepID=UPI001FB591D3|nr:hypothetical protein [Agromyces protaetiae]